MQLLIIDQTKLVATILHDALRHSHVTVDHANTKAQGFALLAQKKYDFVGIAMQQDSSDGIVLTQQIRKKKEYQYTPIIVFTSTNPEQIHTEAIRKGVTDVFGRQQLDELVNFITRLSARSKKMQGRILLVEDSLTQQQIITSLFRAANLQVDAFTKGEEALQQFRQQEYDLVITDIVLAGQMSGVMLSNHIRRQGGLRGDTPILAMTGFDDMSKRISLFQLGINDYIVKPIIVEELTARVNNLLALRQSQKLSQQNLQSASETIAQEKSARISAESEKELLQQQQNALTAIGRSSIVSLNLSEYIGIILGILSKIEWIQSSVQGALFLYDRLHNLIMAAEKGLDSHQQKICSGIVIQHNPSVTFQLAEQDGQHYCVLALREGKQTIGVLIFAIRNGRELSDMQGRFLTELADIVTSLIQRRRAEEAVLLKQFELEYTRDDFIRTLGSVAEFHDTNTGMHIVRMSKYSAIIARAAGYDQNFCKLLEKAAPMHDIGKICITDLILKKPAKLTAEEFAVMKTHTTQGAKILDGDGDLMELAREIAITHHEKWNGTGYPNGLRGEEIPISGRICAVADVFDALTMARPYKQEWPLDKAMEAIRDGRGTHFDPDLVDALERALPQILQVKQLYSDTSIMDSHTVMPDLHDVIEDPQLAWDDSYSVANELIDVHHQYLLHAINMLHNSILRHERADKIAMALFALRSYTIFHFRSEEQMMQQSGYAQLDKHKAEHNIFEEKINRFYRELQFNPTFPAAHIITYLQEWLIHHICKSDKEFFLAES